MRVSKCTVTYTSPCTKILMLLIPSPSFYRVYLEILFENGKNSQEMYCSVTMSAVLDKIMVFHVGCFGFTKLFAVYTAAEDKECPCRWGPNWLFRVL